MNNAERTSALEDENERLALALRRAEQLREDLEALNSIEALIDHIEETNLRMTRALARHEELKTQLESVADQEVKS